MLRDEELRGVPLLVMANKQDLPDALETEHVADKLGLDTVTDRKWHIQPTCAMNGDGICEGLDWMAELFEHSSRGTKRNEGCLPMC